MDLKKLLKAGKAPSRQEKARYLAGCPRDQGGSFVFVRRESLGGGRWRLSEESRRWDGFPANSACYEPPNSDGGQFWSSARRVVEGVTV